jgi:hypothetical protein
MASAEEPPDGPKPLESRSELAPEFRDAGDPVKGNPFPPDNPRHATWQEATLKAEEEWCRCVSVFMKNRPSRGEFVVALMAQRHIGWEFELNMLAAKFDIWAKRGCYVVWNADDLQAYDRWLFDYAEAWLAAEKKAGSHAILGEVQSLLIERMNHWKAVARRLLTTYHAKIKRLTERPGANQAESPRAQNSENAASAIDTDRAIASANPGTLSWPDIEIRFLNDHYVQIFKGGKAGEVCNYPVLAFEDRRSGKQSLAWEMLLELARNNGMLPRKPAGTARANAEKRIEEIRERFRKYFDIKGDPIPFNGTNYQTSFKISLAPSFDK